MKHKKTTIGCGIILLVFATGLFYIWHLVSDKGMRNLGDLSDPCNKQYKINITQYAEYDHVQPLYFSIKESEKALEGFDGQFEITNDMDEHLDHFEIHCYDNILYVTWKEENHPLIMFDAKTKHLYYSNSNDQRYKKILFEKIKKGNWELEMD